MFAATATHPGAVGGGAPKAAEVNAPVIGADRDPLALTLTAATVARFPAMPAAVNSSPAAPSFRSRC
jgi:hypothetical protein